MGEIYPHATKERVQDLSKRLGEPDWLRTSREQAFKRYQSLEFETSPLFLRHVERPRGIEKLEPRSIPTAKTTPALPAGVAAHVVLGPEEAAVRADAPARGVTVAPFSRAIQEDPELVRTLLSQPMRGDDEDKMGNLCRALFSNGILVNVPAGVEIAEPIHLVQRPEGGAQLTRTVIRLEPSAAATIAEEISPAAGLLLASTEIHLAQGAKLRYASVQNGSREATTLVSREAHVFERASIDWTIANVGCDLAKSILLTDLVGEGASVKGRELAFGAGTQRVDSTVHIRHEAGGTVSDYLAKAVHTGRAKSYLKGRITIAKPAVESDSYLGQYAMLLSKESRSIAIPSLEIECMAVKRAKHAAAVAQIDEEQRFYLETRGLPETEAERVIVRGFLDPVLEAVPYAPLRDPASRAIDERLAS